MAARLRFTSMLLAAMALLFSLAFTATRNFVNHFPPLSMTLSVPTCRLQDFIGISLGLRRLSADLAWIQTLIYYGTIEPGHSFEEMNTGGGGEYTRFLDFCRRTITIDPTFKYVYYYGAGVLGWNLNRRHEAEALLQEGIRAMPKEWRLQQYLAALAYQQDRDANKLTLFLESFISDPECPNLLRSMLAKTYKKQHRYQDALRVWMMIRQSNDPTYIDEADKNITEISLITIQIGNKAH